MTFPEAAALAGLAFSGGLLAGALLTRITTRHLRRSDHQAYQAAIVAIQEEADRRVDDIRRISSKDPRRP